MLLIDSHCHLDGLNYTSLHRDLDDVIAKAAERDVRFMLAISTTLSEFKRLSARVAGKRCVALSCGVHPLELAEPFTAEQLTALASAAQVIALGETGLDYYYQTDNCQQQQWAFRQHLRVACQLKKPIIVHTRNAQADTLTLLHEEQAQQCGGILHCFTEDIAFARQILDLGFYLSFSGIITFRNAEQLRQVARFVPVDRLLYETDSPYLAPVPYRSKENQPAYVREVATCLAQLKGIDLEDFAEITRQNFSRLFHLSLDDID